MGREGVSVSDRPLTIREGIVWQVKASPERAGAIIDGYLDSRATLTDPNNLAPFVHFLWSEVIQTSDVPAEGLIGRLGPKNRAVLGSEVAMQMAELWGHLTSGIDLTVLANAYKGGDDDRTWTLLRAAKRVGMLISQKFSHIPGSQLKQAEGPYKAFLADLIRAEAGIVPDRQQRVERQGRELAKPQGPSRVETEKTPMGAFFWISGSGVGEGITTRSVADARELATILAEEKIGPITGEQAWKILLNVAKMGRDAALAALKKRVLAGVYADADVRIITSRKKGSGLRVIIYWPKGDRLYFKVGNRRDIYGARSQVRGLGSHPS